tara:strand:- start:589 stop:1266 length:678 start_codon:yes stop_codon:yes gene_type:complete
MTKIVLCTGGFDPIHSGHIDYLNEAAKLGDTLVVGLNSDDWLIRKKGKAFMPWEERKYILEALRCVDSVVGFDDDDGTANDAINQVRPNIFANGGDRNETNTPEVKAFEARGVTHVFGVGGDKKNSSSSILRKWGWFDTLFTAKDYKVKKLTVMPKCQLSNQRHSKREEHWIILSGRGMLNGEPLNKYEHIKVNEWHHLVNTGDDPLIIIETQIGECDEEDIHRA